MGGPSRRQSASLRWRQWYIELVAFAAVMAASSFVCPSVAVGPAEEGPIDSIAGVRPWLRQNAVLIGVYREGGWHEDYLVSLETGGTIWSSRQRLAEDEVTYFGPISPDGTRVIVYYVSRGSKERTRRRHAVGVAETESPDRVKRAWEAPDPERILALSAAWSPKGDEIFVQDVEEALFKKPGRAYVARVELDGRDLAVYGMTYGAEILSFWCPPVRPAYCMMTLEEMSVTGELGVANRVLRIPLEWPTGAKQIATWPGRIRQVAPSPDGARVAVYSDQMTADDLSTVLRILRGDDLKPIWELPPALPVVPFSWLTWNPQGTRLIAYGGLGLYLIDVEHRSVQRLDEVKDYEARRAAWAPDGRIVIFSTDYKVMTFDLDTRKVRELWSIPPSGAAAPGKTGVAAYLRAAEQSEE